MNLAPTRIAQTAQGRKRAWAMHIFLLAAGAVQAASLAWPLNRVATADPHGLWQVLALALLAWAVARSDSAGQALRRTWSFSSAWLLGSTWWLYISLHTYGGLPAWMAALAVCALAVALALIYAVFLAWHWRTTRPTSGRLLRSLGFALAWTLAEWTRGHLATGFPWGAIGYAHIDSPLRHWAPWLGVYGVGAIAASLAALLAELPLAWARRADFLPEPRAPKGARAGAAAAVLLLLALPWLPTAPVGQTPALRVRLLQGNVPQDLKFGAAATQAVTDYQRALRDSEADLTVTPETAIPFVPEQWPREMSASFHPTSGHAWIVGLPLRAPISTPTARYTNSAWALLPPGESSQRYDKRHLVPFGEFVPPLFQWFVQRMQIPLGDFARGAAQQPPLQWRGQRIAVNICFEDLFGEELARDFQQPDAAPTLLLNLSNLAWFGDTVALDQHLHISRMRALELGRPLLRATNTGVTALVDAQGQVVQRLPTHTAGALDVEVRGIDGPPTPYARWSGRWGLWPMAALLWLLWWALVRAHRRA